MTLSDPTSMGALLATIGTPMLRVLAAPRGLDHSVRGTLLHDPADPLPDGVDALLLVPGLSPDSPAAVQLLHASRLRGYCGIVLKQRGADATELVAEASESGVTVLVADDDVPWRHLDSLLLSLLGSQGVGGAADASADQLFALTNAMAAVIGGAVAIEDLDRKVIAYSSLPDQRIDPLRQEGILSRRVPEIEHNLQRYRRLIAADGIVRFPDELGALPRAAVAMRAGDRPLGSIWAIEPAGGIGEDGERALLDGARLAALNILRRRNADELEFQMREGALLGALDGAWPADEVAMRLALPAGAGVVLLGFAGVPLDDGPSVLISHLGSALSRYVLAFRSDAGVATTTRAAYVLLPGGDEDAALRLARGALSSLASTFADRVRVGVGRVTNDPATLPALRREVDDVLRVITDDVSLPTVARLADVHTRVLMQHVRETLEREPRLKHPGILAMLAHDSEHKTDFALSVVAWLDAMGDVRATSAQLGVHANTLRYRLRRATELFALDLEDADERLAIWVQLRTPTRRIRF